MSASDPTAIVPLRGKRPKSLAGAGGDDFDEAIGREAFAVDAAGVDEAEAMLDAGAAVGNFCEVVDAELLLVFEAERAVIGGDDLQACRA